MRKLFIMCGLVLMSLFFAACARVDVGGVPLDNNADIQSDDNDISSSSFEVNSCTLGKTGNERTTINRKGYDSPYAMYACGDATVRLNLYSFSQSSPAEFIKTDIDNTRKYAPVSVSIEDNVLRTQSEQDTFAYSWYDSNSIVYAMVVELNGEVPVEVENLKLELLTKHPSAMKETEEYFGLQDVEFDAPSTSSSLYGDEKSCAVDKTGTQTIIIDDLGYPSPFVYYTCAMFFAHLNVYFPQKSTSAEFIKARIDEKRNFGPVSLSMEHDILKIVEDDRVSYAWYTSNPLVFILAIDNSGVALPADFENLKNELIAKNPSVMVETIDYFQSTTE